MSSIEEKTRLLGEKGIDHLIIIPFTERFSSLSSEEFIKDILVDRIGTKKLVIGYDHKFGKNRSGSFEELKKDGPIYGFDVEEIPKQMIENKAVSIVSSGTSPSYVVRLPIVDSSNSSVGWKRTIMSAV